MMTGEERLRQEKRRRRREIRAEAAALPAEYRAEASRRMAEQVRGMEAYRRARVVMMFMSLPEEPDTRLLIADALDAGKTVLLPRCVSPERMIALPFAGWDQFEAGYLNIQEPPMPEERRAVPAPELILVPCVTASADGRRLGHGAGYYDRFLAGQSAETVCLCFRRLMREEIPCGPLDRRMGRVISD